MEDEIVTTMTNTDWNTLRVILHDCEIKGVDREIVWKLLKRLAHNADTLSLEWLDAKRAEFP